MLDQLCTFSRNRIRKLIEKERECEELKVRLREAQIGYEIKKASLDYLCSKYHIDLKKKIDLD